MRITAQNSDGLDQVRRLIAGWEQNTSDEAVASAWLNSIDSEFLGNFIVRTV
jgi:hypothetical protein